MTAFREVKVDNVDVAAYTIPTEEPESDGTFEWDSTTVVVVHAHGGGERGLGYTYGSTAAATVIHETLASRVIGASALDVRAAWRSMVAAVRNLGRPGVAATAISAMDIALWDLKARLLDLPLVSLLDRAHDAVPIYGSGGFTSYSLDRLTGQLSDWAARGFPAVKMKVGRHPEDDLVRVLAVSEALGAGVDVMVDANGAYSVPEALRFAEHYADLGVGWFEEPVSSDDVPGLRLVRRRAPGYEAMVHVPVQIPTLADLAVRHALARRGVSHLTIPNDVQVADAEAVPWPSIAPASTPATAAIFIPAPGVPRADDLRRAAAVLNHGTRVVLLAGAGALGARPELLEVAERLGSPIVKTLPGKAAVPDDHPLTTGGIGLLGTRPSEEAMEQADTLLMVGTNFPYTKHLPEPGQARVVQIEADPIRAGNRIPTEVPLVGDAAQTLRALLPLLDRHDDRAFLETAQAGMAEWRQKMAATEDSGRDPIQPQYLMRVIDRHAADDAILASDSGTIATWSARHFDIRGDRRYYLSGNLATMAPGLPYTIAAQLAHPGRQCIAFVGDGGFAMLMAEFLTAVRHELPIKVFINNNHGLGQILWEQMVLGYPEFGVRHSGIANYAAFAEANGGRGMRVEHAGDVDGAVKEALAYPGPVVVDVLTNPDEPPLPPKVTYEQAKGFTEAFLKGQPHRATIATTLFKDKLSELRS